MSEVYDYKDTMFGFGDTLVKRHNAKELYLAPGEIGDFIDFCVETFHNQDLIEYIFTRSEKPS